MKCYCYKHRSLFHLLCLLIFSVHTKAQSNQSFTLLQLTDSAGRHLPLLQQKKAMIASARVGITDAKHSFLPGLNVGDEISIGSANDVQGGFLPVSGIIHPISGSIIATQNNNAQMGTLASAYAEFEVVTFGRKQAKVNNAVAYADLQQADFDKTEYVTKMQIGKLFFEILKHNSLLNIDLQNISRYQSVYTIIKALTGSGIKAGVDSSLALAELSKTRIMYNQRQGALSKLKQELSYLTGIPASRLVLDTVLHLQMTDTDSIVNNPLLDYYTQQLKLVQADERLTSKSYLPKVIVGAGGWGRGSSIVYNDQYSHLTTGLGMQRFNYIGGIGITYDLINLVHRHDKLAIAHYQSQAAAMGFDQQQQVLNNAIEQARISIATDEKNLAEIPVQLKAANNAYQQKLSQYKAGVINLIDLLNASFVLYTTQQNYAETLNDWYNAHLDQATAMGTLEQFIQQLKQ